MDGRYFDMAVDLLARSSDLFGGFLICRVIPTEVLAQVHAFDEICCRVSGT